MKLLKLFILCVLGFILSLTTALGQSWQPLTHQPTILAGANFLLTDGSVMVQDRGTQFWWKLTPDNTGSYVNGTWTQLASMPNSHAPLYFAGAVLADGRVIICGGEYNFLSAVWTNKCSVYDPVTNTWSILAPPAGWTGIGDAQCAVMPDGKFMLANLFDTRQSVLDPATMTWTALNPPGHADRFDEEGWTLLPDGTLFTVDAIAAPRAERYIPSTNTWIFAGNTPQILTHAASQEMGPNVLMYDGRVLCTGATGHNAIYTPPTNLLDPGTWVNAPDFPIGLDIADGPATLLPNGKVLTGASPGIFNAGTRMFEFDGTAFNEVPRTPRSPINPSYVGNMLMLPTGQVMYTDFSSDVEIYTPAPGFAETLRPTITDSPTVVQPGQNFVLTGTQLNGLSQCNSYGDEIGNYTNYPIVRITNAATNHVAFCRTSGHSTMAIATGTTPVTTNVEVPSNIEPGNSIMEVVTNGIPSLPVPIAIGSGGDFPIVTTIAPSSVVANSGDFTLTVNGVQFVDGDVVTWTVGTNVTNLTTTFVSATQVTAAVPNSLILDPGTAQVRLTRTGGVQSNAQTITITTDAPTLATLAPSSTIAGSANTTVTLNGTRFRNDDTVNFILNGVTTPLSKTFISATQQTAVIPASLLLDPGNAQLQVVNIRGRASNLLAFTITTDAPTITSVAPSSTIAGSATTNITLTGIRYRADDVVNFILNGVTTPLAKTFISATQQTAVIPASLLLDPGNATIQIVNYRGRTSNLAGFTITTDAPVISVISPSQAIAGSATVNVTLTGSRFRADDIVRWTFNGVLTQLAMTFVSANQENVIVPASLLATQGSATIQVINYRNRGSNFAGFTVTPDSPLLFTLTPDTVEALSGAQTITLTGDRFKTSDIARITADGILTSLATTYVSPTQLTAVVPSSLLQQGGTESIDVIDFKGQTSGALTFNIINPLPVVTSISPGDIHFGSAGFVLTVNGSKMIDGGWVEWRVGGNKTPLVTHPDSTSLVTADVPPSLLVTPGKVNIVYVNPAPGGGDSLAVSFFVTGNVTLTSVTPNSFVLGNPVILTLRGTAFESGAMVQVGDINTLSSFVDSTRLTASIRGQLFKTAGTYAVHVTNPSGDVSNSLNITVNNPVPTITTVSPTTVAHGGTGFTLTVNGTKYVRTSVVRWKNTNLTTTYVSANKLTAVVPASLYATAGTNSITVRNPTPGGGTSSGVNVVVN